MLAELEPGDTVIVWKLDRLSRSMLDFLRLMEQFREKEIGFVSLGETIDTTTPAGRMMMHMLAAFAQFERDMIAQRTKAGIERAKARGQRLGRKPSLTPFQKQRIVERVADGEVPADLARELGLHRSTICRVLKAAKEDCVVLRA